MEIALGALVALAYGSGDFLGGFASQRLRTSTVLLGAQSIGLVVALLLVIVLRDASPDAHVYVLSAIAGAVGVVAVALLYRGLAVGRMSVVAPVSAVGGAVLPVMWGLLRGERPSALAWVGIALALIAIVIVGRGAEHDPAPSITPLHELALGAGAGIGFGIVFILFSESASGSGLWPVFIARCTSVPLLIGAVIVLRQPPPCHTFRGRAGSRCRPVRRDREHADRARDPPGPALARRSGRVAVPRDHRGPGPVRPARADRPAACGRSGVGTRRARADRDPVIQERPVLPASSESSQSWTQATSSWWPS